MTSTPKIGHNSAIDTTALRAYFTRIERLEDERKILAEDIKEVRAEAKATGHNMAAFNKAYGLYKLDAEKQAMLGVYVNALGLFE
jgi:uncharacterized protein (UPF0335 family)